MENVHAPKAAWNLNGCPRAMSDCKSSVASTRLRVEAALLSCSEGLCYTNTIPHKRNHAFSWKWGEAKDVYCDYAAMMRSFSTTCFKWHIKDCKFAVRTSTVSKERINWPVTSSSNVIELLLNNTFCWFPFFPTPHKTKKKTTRFSCRFYFCFECFCPFFPSKTNSEQKRNISLPIISMVYLPIHLP